MKSKSTFKGGIVFLCASFDDIGRSACMFEGSKLPVGELEFAKIFDESLAKEVFSVL